MDKNQLLSEISGSELYNLHGHTQFCDGREPMEAFAAKAAEMGFTHYGFSPHSPIIVESTCNMSRESVPEYFAEVDRLRALYPQLKIYRSMEIDYLNDSWGPANEYFKGLGLDYAIGSVHFVPNRDGFYADIDGRPAHFQEVLKTHFGGDLRYVVEGFFSQTQAMVAAGGFEIIGHFDKIKHNASSVMPDIEDTDWYKALVGDLIDSIIASGVIVEINTKAWKEFGQLFPAQRHWRRLINAGVPIVVNSDAHYSDRINASRPEVIKALKYLQ